MCCLSIGGGGVCEMLRKKKWTFRLMWKVLIDRKEKKLMLRAILSLSLSLSLWEGGLLLFFFFPFLSFLEVCVDCGIHKVNIFIALHQFYTWSSYQLQWKEFNFLVFLLIHIPAMENSEFCSSQFMSSSCCSQGTLVLALALFTKGSSHCFGVTICGSSSI